MEKIDFIDRRRHERRRFDRKIGVSFYCQGLERCPRWHLGTIQDVCAGGIGIKSNTPANLKRGQHVIVLCLPDSTVLKNETIPLNIQGRVAWHNADNQSFGLCFL